MLLTEAYYNTLHKINFKGVLIPSLEALSGIPQVIIRGRRLQSTTHLALSKKLIADISDTKKLSTATTFADATNCYDRVVHSSSSLCAQCFEMDLRYLVYFPEQ